MLRPSSTIRPLPPLPATSSMSSVIGLPALTNEPATCAGAAPGAPAWAPAAICGGGPDATPCPGEDEPQPESNAATSTKTSGGAPWDGNRKRIAAQTLA